MASESTLKLIAKTNENEDQIVIKSTLKVSKDTTNNRLNSYQIRQVNQSFFLIFLTMQQLAAKDNIYRIQVLPSKTLVGLDSAENYLQFFLFRFAVHLQDLVLRHTLQSHCRIENH